MSTHVLAGLDRGVVALLSSKSTSALLEHVGHADLVLFCASLSAVFRAAPAHAPVISRISAEMTQVLFSIALNTVLQWVALTPDAGLAAILLLAVHFWGGALDPMGQIAVTAEYLLVTTLSAKLRGGGGLLAVAWALAFAPRRVVPPDVSELACLLTTESVTDGLASWLPASLLLPSTAMLLYLCAPFTEEFPVLNRLYRFAVFAFTRDTSLAGLSNWLIAAGLWALWKVEPDPVSRRLAAVAGSNVGVLVVLDAMRFATDNDPAPTLVALLLAVRIFEDNPGK
jgi:hypothetical protein